MSNGTGQQDFETVSTAFVREWAVHRAQTLLDYMERYPDYAADLMLLAVEIEAAEQEQFPVETPPTALRERLLADARAILTAASDPLAGGLRHLAQTQHGLKSRALAAALFVGVDVVVELDEGDVTAIPRAFEHKMAETFQLPMEVVHGHFLYHAHGPAIGVPAYHAPHGHQAPEPTTFIELIERSTLTRDDQKAYWRAQVAQEAQRDA